MIDETITINYNGTEYDFEVSYKLVEAEEEFNIAERVDFVAIWYDGKDFTDFSGRDLKEKLDEEILKNK